jgi:mannosyltransferase OCH1-like enzyme
MERDRANSIPKKLHQIWFGSELPAQYAPLIKKLKELHPDWEYKLWNENNINFDLINPEFFQRATNPGQKSDILRYEILNQFGGVYLDLDHAAINRFDHLLFLESFAGVTYDGAPQITNSVIGSRPRSPLTQKLCRFEAGFIENPNVKEIFQTTGPDFFTKVFNSLILENPGMVAFPNAYFSPYPNFPKDRVKGNDFNRYLKKETICCHLWHCSWIKTNTR